MTRIVGDGGSAGGIEPLRWVRYVDPETLVAPDQQDGSIAAPYTDTQTAFDELVALGVNRGTIVICPSQVAIASAIDVLDTQINFSITLRGEGGPDRSVEDGGSAGFGATVQFAGITVQPGGEGVQFNLQNLQLVTTEETTGDFRAPPGPDNDPPATPCRVAMTGVGINRIVAPASDFLLVDTSVTGNLQASRVDAYDCTGGNAVSSWNVDTLVADEATNAALTENATTVNATSIFRIQGRCERVTISVPVPALAAGELGYVDVSTGGVMVVRVGDVVVAAPEEDLAAAGADGGFYCNARVSALNTVRLAFEGELTGGDVDFIFARV